MAPTSDEINAATVTLKGDEWGDPLWTVEEAVAPVPEDEEQPQPSWSIDVHATDEADARAKALVAITPTPASQTLEERATAALESLPPDRVVTASELLAIIRGA